MSTLAIVAGVVGLVCVIALLYLNFKAIPDLAKSNPEDIEGNLSKVVLYGKIYIALTVIILVCFVILLILGITRLFSGSSQPKPEEMSSPDVSNKVSDVSKASGTSFTALNRYSAW